MSSTKGLNGTNIVSVLNNDMESSPQEDGGGQFYWAYGVDNRVFSTRGMEVVPPPLTKNYSSLPPGKVFPVDFLHQMLIPPHQGFIPPKPLNSTFLLKIFFPE